MTRAWPLLHVVLLAVLAACGGGPAPDLLPAELAGWTRGEVRQIAPGEAPEPVTSTQRIVQAKYADVTVRVYEVMGSAIALDFVQRWQAPGNVTYFYEGSYVAVIAWERAERPDLREFSTALRAHLRSL